MNNDKLLVCHLFCKANFEHLYNLCCLLLCFKAISGLKISLAQSELVLVGDVDDVGGLASILGCRCPLFP
jgi:hypothetical protein